MEHNEIERLNEAAKKSWLKPVLNSQIEQS